MKEKVTEEERKKFLTYFILFFPSIIIAIVPTVDNWNILGWIIKILLILYQFIAIKNFIDSHYQ